MTAPTADTLNQCMPGQENENPALRARVPVWVTAIVSKAPPLTPEQIEIITRVFKGATK